MDGRSKLVLFIDESVHLDRLNIFEQLSNYFEIEVIAQCKISYFDHYHTKLPIKLIENLPEKDGYLPGIEILLKDAEVVFCFSTFAMSTFQILRASSKLGFKVIAMVSDDLMSFESWTKGEVAIHKKALSEIEHFFTNSERSQKFLLLQGVSEIRISHLPIFLKANRYGFHDKARKKFRDYISLAEDEILVLLRGICDPAVIRGICGAAKLLMLEQSIVRFKFIWNDVDFDTLKQTVFNFGLAKQMILLDQNPSSFIVDLLSASDISINSPTLENRGPNRNCELLQALCSGLVSLSSDRLDDESLDFQGLQFGQDFTDAVYVKQLLLTTAKALNGPEVRVQQSDFVCRQLQSSKSPEIFEEKLLSIIASHKKTYDADVFERLSVCISEHEIDAKFAKHIVEYPAINDKQKACLLSMLGDRLAKEMNFIEAIDIFEKALEFDCNYEKVYFSLGKVSYTCHSDSEALRFFRRVLKSSPNHPDALRYIGCIYRRRGLSDDAIVWFKKAILADSNRPQFLLETCQTALECENIKRAISVLKTLVQIFGETKALTMALGQLHLKQGDYELGQKMLNKALEDGEEINAAAKA